MEAERRQHWEETELLNQEMRKFRQAIHEASTQIETISEQYASMHPPVRLEHEEHPGAPQPLYEMNYEPATPIGTFSGAPVQASLYTPTSVAEQKFFPEQLMLSGSSVAAVPVPVLSTVLPSALRERSHKIMRKSRTTAFAHSIDEI